MYTRSDQEYLSDEQGVSDNSGIGRMPLVAKQ